MTTPRRPPHLSLLGIDWVHCTWTRAHPLVIGPLSPPPSLNQRMGISMQVPERFFPGSVSFLAVLRLHWFNVAEPYELFAQAEAHLRVAYAFDDPTRQLEPNEARVFAEGLVKDNAWPYMRQRVQLFCQELGIAPFLLPLRPLSSVAPGAETQEP